ncbi:MAG TPA: AAA family ATPase [Anaerolineales bacterium]|jgi:class 3 adenylate cyclase
MIKTLAVYVPEDRRQAFARGQMFPERVQGAALFADISGFTPLTEALVKHHGPQRGAEELSSYLDQVYNALIQQLHLFGGSVIGYSGDAITCWLDQDDGCRATAAALGMQTAIKELLSISFPSGETIPLALKVAVVVGAGQRLLVGDPNIQLIDVLAGSVAQRLALAEQTVHTGEVLVELETAQRLADLLLTSEQRYSPDGSQAFTVVTGLRRPVESRPWLELPLETLTEASLRPWVLPAQYERIRQGHGQFLTELRPTVALFLRFGGIDYEHDPDAGKKLDDYLRWVQAVLARYEGVLLQVTLGEKGSYLYGTFGAPVVHEDDTRRAVAAALELRSPPASLSYITPVPIGLSRGIMRTGPTGSTLRRTYGVLGDEVNVAARLMQAAAPGEIIVSERVMKRVTGLFELQPLPPLKVKGKAEPVPIYRVSSAISRSKRVASTLGGLLVGRAGQRSQLDEKTRELLAGQSSVIVIEGEAGIGKSRLIGDWLAAAPPGELLTLTGSGDAIEQSTPYHAWRSIFGQLFQWDSLPDEPAAQLEHVLVQLRTLSLEQRAPLLNVVLPLELPDNPLTIEMTGKVRADNTQDVLVALLQQVASGQPLRIVIEDSHWLDSASWALALTVVRQVQPLLFTLAIRPLSADIPGEYQALLDQPGTLRLPLETLKPQDTIQLVCQRLGVEALPERISVLILEKAEGHPFFSEELAYALRDSGVLRIVDGQASIAPGVKLSSLNLPDTVEGVVTSRIDLLSASEQLVLKVASVIGTVFSYRLLGDIHPVPTDRPKLPEFLDHLENLDVTPLVSPPPDLSYMFKHIITREVTYNLLLFAQRRQLHQAVAEWYEQTFARDLSQFYPLLAHHWTIASENSPDSKTTLKSLEYLEKAGDLALLNYANHEAVDYFNRLLSIVTEQNAHTYNVSILRLAQWEQQLGEAHNRLGHLEECEQHFGKSLQYLGWLLPGSTGRLVTALLMQVVRQAATRLQPTKNTSRKALTAEALEARRLACKIYERLGLLYFLKNNTGMTVYCPLASLNLAEEIGPSPELAIAYSYATGAAGLIPAHGLAGLYERLTLQTAEQVNNPMITARALMGTNVYTSGAARLAETGQRLHQAIASFEQGGVWEWWGVCMEMLTRIKYYQGQFQQSAELADRLYAMSKQQGDIVKQSWSLTSRMETHLLLADRDDILILAAELEELVRQSNETGPRQKFYGVSALVHLQNGDWAAADESAKQLLKLISGDRPTSFGLLTGYIAAADTYLSIWERRALPDLKYLQAQATLACKLLTKFAQILPIGEPARLRANGLLAWLTGRSRQAQKLWAQSLLSAQGLHMPLDEALAHFELGRHLSTDDPQRDAHLDRARQLFHQMGVKYYDSRMLEAVKPTG